ncbi:MAG: di-trans,poly-cis-decaprenylcistransferase [Spirochaetaceae bacterium]|nr:di-trans,poly-cis-decaprenylcistransferase [Spirochaetaceae bacterium]
MNQKNLPTHVAIIMDGNGRWASRSGLPRTEGHREGLSTAKKIVKLASSMGISYLSLYTFSTENWKRAQEEVGFLMALIKNHLSAEFDFYRQNRIKVVHSGQREGLPVDILEEIDEIVRSTSTFPGMVVNLAINYGGRNELARAMQKAARAGESFDDPEKSEKKISAYLDHPEIPDPDLVIRTAGEYRISNFLLWESAYSELYFSGRLWPDFSADDFKAAIEDYAGRERRFGGA